MIPRLAIYGAILAALVLGAIWLRHSGYKAGEAATEGRMAIAAAKQAQRAELKEQDDQRKLDQAVKDYETKLAARDAAVDGLASRLRQYQVRRCPVPQAAATADGAGNTAPEPGGDEAVGRATQAVFDACRADAAQLEAVQKAWPR